MNNKMKAHYSWVICFASLLMFFCNMGMCNNLLSVYLPFIEENGLSHSMGSAILTTRTLFAFLALFGVVAFYRRLTLRRGILLVTILGAASKVIFSFGGSPAVYYLAAAIAGVNYAFGSVYPASLLLTNWFHARRGLAVGISSAGSGLCNMLLAPIVSQIITRYSLRTSFLFEALLLVAAALLMFCLVRETPAEMEMLPYGEGESTSPGRSAEGAGAETAKEPSVVMLGLLAAMMLLNGASGLSFSGHLSVLTKACGYAGETAASVFSAFGFALLIGKFLAGGVADRIGTRRSSALFTGIFIMGCLCVIGMNGINLFWPFAMTLLIGFGASIFNVGPTLWAADLGGGPYYAKTLRWLQIFYNLGGVIFTIVPGIIADHTGEYKTSYFLFAGMMAVSACILQIAYRRTAKK